MRYYLLLDILPALALGQFCSKLFLTLFHGSPEASGWLSTISFLLGVGVGTGLSYYIRMQVTKYIQNRRAAFIVSLSISLGLAFAILLATVLIEKSAIVDPFAEGYVDTFDPNYKPQPSGYVDTFDPNYQPPKSRDRGAALFKDVINAGKQCASENTGTQVISCFARASPKKCESIVYAHFANLAGGHEYTPAWAYCVASCADAGAWSRNFGECSRELK